MCETENAKGQRTAFESGVAIVAVVVLYRLRAEESVAFRSLQTYRAAAPELAAAMEVMVWDNSPGEREKPQGFEGIFRHDANNPGLAAAYDAALEHADAVGAPWLMLLDQDTALTEEYLQEALATAQITQAVAIVPRLTHANRVVSPFLPQAQGPVRPVEDGIEGLLPTGVQAFNSGAVLSVSAMERLGGFDRTFPLDYLDHATFAALQNNGGKVHLLRSSLIHELATDTGRAMTPAGLRRQRDILAAERRYIAKYGTPHEQRMWPVRVLRHIVSVLLHKGDVRHAWLILRSALRNAR